MGLLTIELIGCHPHKRTQGAIFKPSFGIAIHNSGFRREGTPILVKTVRISGGVALIMARLRHVRLICMEMVGSFREPVFFVPNLPKLSGLLQIDVFETE